MHNAISGTTRRYTAYALDSARETVSGGTIHLYVHNYTLNTWWNGSTWQTTRTYVTLIDDAYISGLYYYPVILPESDNGLYFFAEPITGTIANGPWAEEAWVIESTTTSSAQIVLISNALASISTRLEGFLKRIEGVVNQSFNIIRRMK